MSYPKTKEEWWKSVDDHWEDYIEIFEMTGAPMSKKIWNAHAPVVNEHSLAVTLEISKKNRDHLKIYELFSMAWAAAPDKPYIHGWASWGDLCDICSEYPDIFEDELRDFEG